MKLALLLVLSTFLVSCASTGRDIAASDERSLYEREERYGDHSGGYRQ